MSNTQPKFKTGDVVELKSGSPDMTINKFEKNVMNANEYTGYTFCIWFLDGKRMQEKFHQDTLEKAQGF